MCTFDVRSMPRSARLCIEEPHWRAHACLGARILGMCTPFRCAHPRCARQGVDDEVINRIVKKEAMWSWTSTASAQADACQKLVHPPLGVHSSRWTAQTHAPLLGTLRMSRRARNNTADHHVRQGLRAFRIAHTPWIAHAPGVKHAQGRVHTVLRVS